MHHRPPPKRTSRNASGHRDRAAGGKRKYDFTEIERLINAHRTRISKHPLLKRLERSGAIHSFHIIAKAATFYVLSFQDMLRLVSRTVTDPSLKRLASVHEMEDKGHDKWFLSDLTRFGISLDPTWIFGPAHERCRDVCYELVAEILMAKDDWSRIAVVLSLEGVGAECFDRAIEYLERLGQTRGLKYFARRHQHVEREHEVFDQRKRVNLLPSYLSREAFYNASRAVQRTFSLMSKFLGYLEESVANAAPEPRTHLQLTGRRSV